VWSTNQYQSLKLGATGKNNCTNQGILSSTIGHLVCMEARSYTVNLCCAQERLEPFSSSFSSDFQKETLMPSKAMSWETNSGCPGQAAPVTRLPSVKQRWIGSGSSQVPPPSTTCASQLGTRCTSSPAYQSINQQGSVISYAHQYFPRNAPRIQYAIVS
jgi:hypothetical protein